MDNRKNGSTSASKEDDEDVAVHAVKKRNIDSTPCGSQSSSSKKCRTSTWMETDLERDLKLTSEHINQAFLSAEFKSCFKKSWQSKTQYESKDYNGQLLDAPFQIAILKNFLNTNNVIEEIVNEMVSVIRWKRKQMDLYEFFNTWDLSSGLAPHIDAFFGCLQTTIMPLISQLTNLQLTSVSATCSMYNSGDYLLVHDDLMTDRRVAFVFYVSPWTDAIKWTNEMGGALELFEGNSDGQPVQPPVEKIYPTNNQFVFFLVSDHSFHQVGEVTTFDYPRLTINGWFHGPPPLTSNNRVDLIDWINEVYTEDSTKASLQKYMEENSEASLIDFLLPNIFTSAEEQLRTSTELSWCVKGPANIQNYECLDLKSAHGMIRRLVELFRSDDMLALLNAYTELDLATTRCTIDVQRWTNGCYTILGNATRETSNISCLDVIFYLNAIDNVGVITYLVQDGESDDVEAESDNGNSICLTVYPKSNALNLVYRSPENVRFTKYVSKNVPLNGEYTYMVVYLRRIWASLAFIFVIILIGVPMWWKTTEVYRVDLPYTKIAELEETTIRVLSNIGIYIRSPDEQSARINELRNLFRDDQFVHLNFFPIELSDSETSGLKVPAALEKLVTQQTKLHAGDFVLIEWANLTSDEILVGAERTAFMGSAVTALEIEQVLRLWIYQVPKLESIHNDVIRRDKMFKHERRSPLPHYDVLISVLNPRPDLHRLKWNLKAAIDDYIEPFLTKTKGCSNFTLKSQWKYQLPFEFARKQVLDSSKLKRHYVLAEETLPHIITSVERKLGNEIKNSPIIHLVVYSPPCETAPLFIYNNGKRVSNNTNIDSFISPNWGAVIIANPSENECQHYLETQNPNDITIDSDGVMQTMLHLLRKLMNLEIDTPIANARQISVTSIAPRLWEIDARTRSDVVHLVYSSISTLKSLIKLLEGISYIVINDDVGAAIKNAYNQIITARECLELNELDRCVDHATSAFASAEKAFFDPSLLALLYFPDEQKYAIYIPLFLPIMIPVILSINSIKKMIMARRDCGTDEKLKVN